MAKDKIVQKLIEGGIILDAGLILALGANAAYIGGAISSATAMLPLGVGALLVVVGAGARIAQALKK